jgi:hypothetical protein
MNPSGVLTAENVSESKKRDDLEIGSGLASVLRLYQSSAPHEPKQELRPVVCERNQGFAKFLTYP